MDALGFIVRAADSGHAEAPRYLSMAHIILGALSRQGENPSQATPSPALGEHSRSILEKLGYSSEEIDAHIADGSVACS